MRRQPGNRYEIVCPVNETDALGYFTKQWVHINEPKASITFKMCVPNGSTFVRKVGYNQSYDECCIPFPTNLLRLEEAQKELVKIRRGYIMYHLIRSSVRDCLLSNNYPAMLFMVGYFRLQYET